MVKFDRTIKPGQAGKVKLSINVEKMSGKFTKRTLVVTNDPKMPRFRFKLTGVVIPVAPPPPAPVASH